VAHHHGVHSFEVGGIGQDRQSHWLAQHLALGGHAQMVLHVS
jgi:hypothetical protein